MAITIAIDTYKRDYIYIHIYIYIYIYIHIHTSYSVSLEIPELFCFSGDPIKM